MIRCKPHSFSCLAQGSHCAEDLSGTTPEALYRTAQRSSRIPAIKKFGAEVVDDPLLKGWIRWLRASSRISASMKFGAGAGDDPFER